MQALADTWDFSKEDAAPDVPLNEAIWKSVRGADSRMPAPVNAAFVSVPARAAGRLARGRFVRHSRCRSIQTAHGIRISPAIPLQATVVMFGGGGPKAAPA